jgi:enoyl-CoA hydratase/carnithine racemase
MASKAYNNLSLERKGDIIILTLQKPPENRLNRAFSQEIISALRDAEHQLASTGRGGALITRGNDEKFFCTGVDLSEGEQDPYASTEGFYPLLATLLDFNFPTVALVNGHVFGGGCPFALAHDYRVMNVKRGFFCMPPIDLGVHFEGIGALPRLKLRPQVARKLLLEAHRFTGKEAFEDGIVDAIAEPEKMLDVAIELAEKWKGKGKMGVYALLRNELYGDAAERLRRISYVHGKKTWKPSPKI